MNYFILILAVIIAYVIVLIIRPNDNKKSDNKLVNVIKEIEHKHPDLVKSVVESYMKEEKNIAMGKKVDMSFDKKIIEEDRQKIVELNEKLKKSILCQKRYLIIPILT